MAYELADSGDVVDAASLKLLLSMVSGGLCIGVVGPAQAEMVSLANFAVRPIEHPGARFTTHMLYTDKPGNPAVISVLRAVREAWQHGFEAPAENPEVGAPSSD